MILKTITQRRHIDTKHTVTTGIDVFVVHFTVFLMSFAEEYTSQYPNGGNYGM